MSTEGKKDYEGFAIAIKYFSPELTHSSSGNLLTTKNIPIPNFAGESKCNSMFLEERENLK